MRYNLIKDIWLSRFPSPAALLDPYSLEDLLYITCGLFYAQSKFHSYKRKQNSPHVICNSFCRIYMINYTLYLTVFEKTHNQPHIESNSFVTRKKQSCHQASSARIQYGFVSISSVT